MDVTLSKDATVRWPPWLLPLMAKPKSLTRINCDAEVGQTGQWFKDLVHDVCPLTCGNWNLPIENSIGSGNWPAVLWLVLPNRSEMLSAKNIVYLDRLVQRLSDRVGH